MIHYSIDKIQRPFKLKLNQLEIVHSWIEISDMLARVEMDQTT